MTNDRAVVLGCEIDRLDMTGTVARCRLAIEERRYIQQVSVNAAKLVALRRDPHLRDIVNRCALVNADGQSVVWASRLLGDPLPERVAGIDLMTELLALAEEDSYRVFVLGARPDVLKSAIATLRTRYPDLMIAGYRHGYFLGEESHEVAAEVRTAGADILFVAMSSPRKEEWLGEYGPTLGAHVVMGVGGAIDVVAGVTRRAPDAWQRLGLEWLFRLAQEPRRMFPRYYVTNVQFVALVARDGAREIYIAFRRAAKSVLGNWSLGRRD